MRSRGVDPRRHSGGILDVDSGTDHTGTELGGGLGNTLRIACAEGNLHPFGEQSLDSEAADPAGGPGDDCGLACQSEVHVVLLR